MLRRSTMVRPGKQPAPANADSTPDQREAPESVSDPRSLNGINRQLQPDAPSQRQAASAAAAVKRKAGAMSEAERKAKDAERNKRNRDGKKAKLAAAAAVASAVQAPRSFDAVLQHVATAAALGDVEQADFGDWLLDVELWPDDESLGEWRGSDAYQRTKHERIAAFCTCFSRPDGGQPTWTMPYGEVKQRVEEGVTSQPGESLASWDARVRADREARGVPLGDYFANPAAYTWCGIIERTCTCTYDGSRIESDVPGQTCDHYDAAVLEPRARATGSPRVGIGFPKAGTMLSPLPRATRRTTHRCRRRVHLRRRHHPQLRHQSCPTASTRRGSRCRCRWPRSKQCCRR